jgi:presequence protease
MKQHELSPRQKFSEGQIIKGYQIQRVVWIETIRSHFYALEHIRTGARHIHIENDDRENTFAVAFKTVPQDSTGVAHILEHTVLCGSSRYPVRDPFFSMIKRSLNTFMNAFTASDWTLYPFSTLNSKDYYNLMSVYLDAAFFPKIEALSFKQEGHRVEWELDEETGRNLVFKGVVFNEMKGAMSSPDQVMGRSLLNALYPDTTYHYNSGGDPEVIPQLTHEQLIAFHRRYYHPSNAFFYTYGNLSLESHLEAIDTHVLKHFDRNDPQTDVPSQTRWTAPRTVTYAYPLDKTEAFEKKHQFCVAWLMADIKDTFEVLVLAVLEQILMGNSASPLRKALIESQLGSSLSDGSGYDAENRDTLFACGLKGAAPDAGPAVWRTVFEVLTDLVENGIDPEWVDSAMHQIEFHRKEVTNTPYPYGIKLLLSFSAGWFHGGDPVRVVEIDDDLAKIREEISKGPFLEEKIRYHFLNNPHRVLFTLAPDMEKMKQTLQKEKAVLADLSRALTDVEKDQIQLDAEALKQQQDHVEDVSVLPTLSLSDIPPEVEKIQPTSGTLNQRPTLFYDRSTGGIVYFTAASIVNTDPDLVPLVPLFCYAVTRSGTRQHDYVEFARLMDLYTGGIALGASARTMYSEAGEIVPLISFNGKCLERNQDAMLSLIEELWLDHGFGDHTRLRNLLLEYTAGLESMVVHNGHRLAISLASRNFTSATALSEIWGGVRQLSVIKEISRHLDSENLKALAAKLKRIGRAVFLREGIRTAVIGDEKNFKAAAERISEIHGRLSSEAHAASPNMNISAAEAQLPYDGWQTASAVSFVARAFQTVRLGHPDAPAITVISKLLRSLFLHREIREKGGAYGGFSLYNSEDGIFSFASYRDPHILNTLDVYERAMNFIQAGNFSNEDVKEGILQVCSEIDKPDPPGPAARKAFYRSIVGLSDEKRQAFKEHLLALDREVLMAAATRHFVADGKSHAIAVISGEAQLSEANEALGDHPLRLFNI